MSAGDAPIVITGFMAVGKTTVAKALAERMGRRVVDLDELIEAREGRSPKAIIDEDGEARFREVEAEALRHALEEGEARVIALGGGAWTVEFNRALVQSRGGFTVWLDAPFELCWKRIGAGGNLRPLARDEEGARRLYESRRPFYEQASLRVYAGADKTPLAIAAEVLDALRRASG